MIMTVSTEELIRQAQAEEESIDPTADATVRAVLGQLGLDEADFGDVIEEPEEDDGEGPTMTAAAKITIAPKAPKTLSAEEIGELAAASIAALTETMYATTDERKLRETQGQINEFSLLERIVPYMPKARRVMRFGHAESTEFKFNTPTIRGVHLGETHSFLNNVYETSDPVEQGALLRLVAEGLEQDDQLVVLDRTAVAYKDKYGRLLGWERPGSANAKRWAKLGLLRTGTA